MPDLSRDLDAPADDGARRRAKVLRVWALLVLVPVAVIGAVLSFQSLYRAAVPVFGSLLALGFPLLVDFLILGASLQYVAGATTGRPRAGWRWTAHAGVVGTLALNAMAARSLPEVPWHVTAPAVWSVLVELTAREVLGEWRAAHAALSDRIPARLWITAPVESARTWLRIARRLEGEQARARLDVGVHAAAVEALKLALPQRRARRVRRILQRQLRAGSLPATAILGPLGWTASAEALTEITPETVLRAALRSALETAVVPADLPPVPPATVPAAGADDVSPAPPPPASPALADPQPASPEPTSSEPTSSEPAEATSVIDLTEPPDPFAAATVGVDHPGASPLRGSGATLGSSTGDRFADAVDIIRVHETVTAAQLATQLRGLGWQLSDRTAGRILTEARTHLLQLDPWALPTAVIPAGPPAQGDLPVAPGGSSGHGSRGPT